MYTVMHTNKSNKQQTAHLVSCSCCEGRVREVSVKTLTGYRLKKLMTSAETPSSFSLFTSAPLSSRQLITSVCPLNYKHCLSLIHTITAKLFCQIWRGTKIRNSAVVCFLCAAVQSPLYMPCKLCRHSFWHSRQRYYQNNFPRGVNGVWYTMAIKQV